MKTKLFLFLFVSIFLVGMVSADLGTYTQGSCVNIPTILNATAVNISTITYPNASVNVINQPMTSLALYSFNYSFCDTNATGQYLYSYYDNNANTYVNSFTITHLGYPVAGASFQIFIWILFLIATIGSFVFLILIMMKLITASETIFGVIISWGFFILLIISNYLATNFLLDNFITNLSGFFIQITVWSNGVLPVISLIITMFIKGTQKKRPLSPQELTGGFR